MDFTNRDPDIGTAPSRKLPAAISDKIGRDMQLPSLARPGQSVALESLDDRTRQSLSTSKSAVIVALEGICKDLKICLDKEGRPNLTDAQKDAAGQAGLMGANWGGFRGVALRDSLPAGSTPGNTITMEAYNVSDVMPSRSYAMEAYDERDNRSAVAYSITYNMQSARQDDFGETLYPTITIPADQAGVTITINLMFVLDNVDRETSGAFYDLKRKNVLRAVADSTVLKKDQTRCVPVFRTESEAMFVDPTVIPTINLILDGDSANPIPTGPVLFGKQIDLLGISQTDAMLNLGTQNQTDTLDPTVNLMDFYVTAGSGSGNVNKLKFDTEDLPFFNFVPSSQGDYKLLVLNAETTSILLDAQTKQYDGSALVGALAQIVTQNLTVRMRTVMSGQVRTDTGNITIYGNTFEVYQITAADGVTVIANTDSSVTALVTALNNGATGQSTFLGYEALAYRSNQNRRQQGQFVDVTKVFQRYMVPLRSPITARHPAHVDGQIDASDIQALITTTRIRIANEAVTMILKANDLLAAYVSVRDNADESPDVLGVGRYYVRPAYYARPFDATTMVDSIKSHERAADIQAALVNEIRDIVYLLYRDSEYKAAADALYGGTGPIPTAVIATDPYTARYLMVTGDLRTLGGEFDVKVVSTLDYRMRGKIIITFGIFDSERNASINPLNNGNLLWAPELVLTANIGRAGQFSRETLVQPRYRFIQNLPVMGYLTVTNIPNVLGKLPLWLVDKS